MMESLDMDGCEYCSEEYITESSSTDGGDSGDDVSEEAEKGDSNVSGHDAEPTAEYIRNREFGTEDEAYELYVKYAKSVGFGVRKGDVGRDESGKIVRRRFVCNREGLRESKYLTKVDRVREHKPETRTNCKAKLLIHLDKVSCRWIVKNMEEGHNHELMPKLFVHLMPSHRRITESDKAQIDSMHRYGMQTSQIMGFMAGQAGGFAGVGFSKKDMYNYIDRARRGKILEGDAAAAISYLEGKADSEPMTVVRYTCSDDDCLGNLFWADGLSRADYEYFGDVITFDSTYKKNKYNRPLVIFSGANHHRQTCIFGFGLLGDERTETYEWLLENFILVMGQKQPNIVVTDGDEAMREAIRRVLPGATHRLCAWHLQKNASANIKNTDFCRAFKRSIYANFGKEEFEQYWNGMVEEFGVADNRWVRNAYERREMWATAYLRDKFSAGIRTTSRCEGINCFIKRFIKSRHSIVDVVKGLEHVLKEYRNNELVAQFQSLYGKPVLTTGLDSIELAAANMYTREIFTEVKKQMQMVASLIVVEQECISTSVRYKMSKFGNPERHYEVLYDMNGQILECTCRFWDCHGIPCSHIFCVMKNHHVCELPKRLVLRRWCKDAKAYLDPPNEERDSERGRLLRYSALCCASMWLAFLGSRDTSGFRSTMECVLRKTNEIEQQIVCGDGRSRSEHSNSTRIGDPRICKAKGAPRAAKDATKQRRCSSCSIGGHTKRNCPTRKCGNSVINEYDFSGRSHEEGEEDLDVNSAIHSSEGGRREGQSGSSLAAFRNGGGLRGGSSAIPGSETQRGHGNMYFGGQQIYHYYPVQMSTCNQGSCVSEGGIQHLFTNRVAQETTPWRQHKNEMDRGHQWHLKNILDRSAKRKEMTE